jgi:hypothetical protein
MMWHDRALIFINAVAMFIFITGLLKEVIWKATRSLILT